MGSKRLIDVANAQKSRVKPATSTFTLLDEDKSRLEEVRRRMAVLGSTLNKSEAVRLSLLAVHLLSDAELSTLLDQLHRLRPGRP